MEFFFDVFSLLPPTEKPAAMSQSMEKTILDTAQSYSPNGWMEHIFQCDCSELECYVVTDLFHYKEQKAFPDFQHEYIVLRVQPKSSSTSAPPHTDIKISRTIRNHALPTRLGLWGSATDTVEVQSPPSAVPVQQIHRLTWQQNNAPTLLRISYLVSTVHHRMPYYCLLKTSCYAFARAIKDAIYRKYNGSAAAPNPPRFLTRQSSFMGCIPTGITKSQKVAEAVIAL
ncbi:hypothetical protein JVT61DRAFT_11330 [Boletus reticuloceps]|uniref:Uncharacterized protein n=1 Tax=Boletus reticuloceps TaxID=495285 RepID=A0A8I2YEV1_9AGAM|nr:hypothetical protein JVT61DRAFT_11330 [Boletus reticuloceps]